MFPENLTSPSVTCFVVYGSEFLALPSCHMHFLNIKFKEPDVVFFVCNSDFRINGFNIFCRKQSTRISDLIKIISQNEQFLRVLPAPAQNTGAATPHHLLHQQMEFYQAIVVYRKLVGVAPPRLTICPINRQNMADLRSGTYIEMF